MANDLDQSISNAIAGGVSAPIDLIAWLLRKAGVPGQEKPVLGSDWMAEKGLTRPVELSPAQIAGETVGNLMDPLGAVGSAMKGGAALKSMLLATAFNDPQTAKALELLRKGELPSTVWQKTGRDVVPTSTSRLEYSPAERADNARYVVKEVPDTRAYLNPDVLMFAGEKANLVKQLEPIGRAAALRRLFSKDIVKPGNYIMQDILKHPELYKERPGFAKMPVTVDPFDTYSFGSYNGNAGSVNLSILPFGMSEKKGGQLSVLLHELTHAEQHLSKMPPGTSPSRFSLSDAQLEDLTEQYLTQGTPTDRLSPEELNDMYTIITGIDNPYKLYRNTLGEQQAEAVEKRLELPQDLLKSIPPRLSYRDLENGFDVRTLYNALRKIPPPPTTGTP